MCIFESRFSSFDESQLLTAEFGCRSGKVYNDDIYAIKQLQANAYITDRKLYTCTVDLTAAH